MRKNVKTRVRQMPVVGIVLEYLLKRIVRRQVAPGLEIRLLAKKLPYDAKILQIGSNDGYTNDPLHDAIVTHANWQCAFVEPVPWLLEKCRGTYGCNNRFRYVNAAINEGKDALFFYVDPLVLHDRPELPEFVVQLGSLSRSHIESYENGILDPYIRSIAVKGLSWNQLLQELGLENVDLLHIDAEGYDWNILEQVNLSHSGPLIILFEILHLGNKQLSQARGALERFYRLKVLDGDMLAVRKDF